MTTFVWPHGHAAALSLSFDDARPSQLDFGAPVFDRHGYKATFYVSLSPLRLRAEEWKGAAANGHEIGNHTVYHPCTGNFVWSREHALEEYTLEQMAAELDAANQQIKEIVGVEAMTFAYPCGQTFVGRGTETRSYIPLVAEKFLAGRGYLAECHNDPWMCDPANLMTIGLDNKDFEEVQGELDRALAQGQWLHMAGHDVNMGKGQVTRVETLDRILNYAREKNFWITTVAEGARYLRDKRKGLD